ERGAGPRVEGDDYDQNFHTLRGKLLFEPTESLEVLLSADYTSREENCCTAVQTVVGSSALVLRGVNGGQHAVAAPGDDPFDRVAYSNRPTTQDIKDKGVSLEVNWDTGRAGGATLTSITGLRDWQSINGLDYDFSTADVLYRNPREDESFTGFETFSQELRLTGSTDRVDWMVGLFYSDEDLDRTETYRVGAQYEPYVSTLITQLVLGSLAAPLAPMPVDMDDPHLFLSQVSGQPFGADSAGLAAHARHLRAAKSLALFTNDAWRATEARDVTLGLRYTREDKELASRYSNPNGSVGCGAMLADPAARVGGALMQRIPGLAMLDADTRAAIIGGAAQQIVGYSCLPWTRSE